CVFTGGETRRAHVVELAGHGQSRRGHTKQENARNGGLEIRFNHGFLLRGFGGTAAEEMRGMLPRLINYDQPNSFRGQPSRGRCSKKEEARLAPGFSTRLTS